MKKLTWNFVIILVLLISVVFSTVATSVQAQSTIPEYQIVVVDNQLEWTTGWLNQGFQLTIVFPEGSNSVKTFTAEEVPVFSLLNSDGASLPDGLYKFQLVGVPELVLDNLEQVIADREAGFVTPIADQKLQIWTGSFTLSKGSVLLPQSNLNTTGLDLETKDIVQLDDVIIYGSLCVGFDCVDGENFGFDTIRLKENNLRIKFEDTSVSSSFPTNDWQITINDSSNGGLNYFAVEDIDHGYKPFLIEAGAGANAFYIDSHGKVGLGTSVPIVELHILDNDTPTIRLDQDSSSGWAPQIWDVAGNEANFFIRDVTNGSKLPFRIQPGAPTSSLTIVNSGFIGLGTWSPSTQLHLVSTATDVDLAIRLDRKSGNIWEMTNQDTGFSIVDVSNSNTVPFNIQPGASADSLTISESGFVGIGTSSPEAALHVAGDVVLEGYLSERSDVFSKENFRMVSGSEILNQLSEIPISVWNYKDDESKTAHMGPMAQDFYAAFGLGKDDTHIGALDVNGVALASIQELSKTLNEKETEIQALRETVENLEVRMENLENVQKTKSAVNLALPFIFGIGGLVIGALIIKKRS